MRSLTKRTLSGLKWSYVAAIAEGLLSLLLLATLSRLLRPADFGLLAIALIFIELAETFSKLGVGPSIVQRLNLTDRHIEIAFTLSMVLGAMMTAATCLLAPLSGPFFDEPRMPQILKVLSIIFVITSVGVVPEHLLRRHLQFKDLMVANTLSLAIGYGLTAIVMALLGFGVWSLVWGTIMRRSIHTLIVIRYSPPPLRLRLAMGEASDLLSYGAGFSLAGVLNFIAQQGGPLVIGRWLGVTSLGYYTRAYSLISVPLRLSWPLIHVLFPAMSERQHQRERLRDIYPHGVEMLSVMALPASVFVFVSAPEVVAVILGKEWDAVVPILRTLALIIPFTMCEAMNPPLLRALGTVYRETFIQGVFVVLIVVGTWLGSRWGVSGVAVAIVIAWICVHLLMTQIALLMLELRWWRLLRCHLPALWVGVWAALALWVTVAQLRTLALPAGLVLLFEILIWVAAVVAAMVCAPPFARLLSVPWTLAYAPLDALGTPGRYLRNALERIPAQRDPQRVPSKV